MSAVEKRKMTFARGRNAGNFRYSVMMPSKGLQNNPGENNCFLNSAVQVGFKSQFFTHKQTGHTLVFNGFTLIQL